MGFLGFLNLTKHRRRISGSMRRMRELRERDMGNWMRSHGMEGTLEFRLIL